MIKHLLIFLLIATYSPSMLAQVNQAEAKAAFLLAEESFTSGNWESTFKYLNQCEELLGTTNSKILYLKLLAQMEVAKENPEYYSKAIHTISNIESQPIVKDFDEDKLLEIMKIKLQVKELQATFEKELKLKSDATIEYNKNFQVVLQRDFKNLPLHVSYSDLMIEKKDHPSLKKKHDYQSEADTYYEGSTTKYNKKQYYDSRENSVGVHVIGDQVHGYRLISKIHFQKKVADAHNTALVDQYTREFGLKPQIENYHKTEHIKTNFDIYTWRNENTIFKLIDRRKLNKNNDSFLTGVTILEVFEW